MSEELRQVLNEYYDTFGDVFPTMLYNVSEQDMIAKVKNCLIEGKDAETVYDIPSDIMY